MQEKEVSGSNRSWPRSPTGAISFEEREAPEYDEEAVKEAQKKIFAKNQAITAHAGCPGSKSMQIQRSEIPKSGEECKIVVISKDTGFDHIIEFWKTEKDVKVSRNEKISGKQVHTRKQVKKQTGKEKDKQVAEQTDQKIEKQLNEQPEKQSAKQSENQNTKKPKQKIIDMKAGTKKLQQELVLVLDKAGMPKEVVNYVSTTVEKNAEDKNRKQQIYLHIQIIKHRQSQQTFTFLCSINIFP